MAYQPLSDSKSRAHHNHMFDISRPMTTFSALQLLAANPLLSA